MLPEGGNRRLLKGPCSRSAAAHAEAQQFLPAGGERYCVIGAIALQRWGEPRATRDVDITLLCPFGSEASAADRLLARFKPRIGGTREFALQRRVLLLWAGDGIGLDVAFGALPFEERCVSRASDWELAPAIGEFQRGGR